MQTTQTDTYNAHLYMFKDTPHVLRSYEHTSNRRVLVGGGVHVLGKSSLAQLLTAKAGVQIGTN